ncbi:MAG: signal recognition particle protein [Nanoarchaeota archaeon]|nr:MAG: signal recognition particle protein [Nanoarchaeota archaeon]
MVLDKLSDSLKSTLQKIASSVFIDEKLINELVKDIQRALLQSDVNVKLVLSLTDRIKERALKEDAPPGLTKREYIVKIVYDELVKFLGESEKELNLSQKPAKIMLVGLFGSGKTTQAGKLGKYLSKRGLRVALLGTDTWRPAAFEQLRQLGQKTGVAVFGNPDEKDPVKIYYQFEKELNNFDVVIIDTAGRDALSEELILELNRLNEATKPSERMLVISADIGQAAEAQAKAFHDTVNITGVLITKLEGTAKGGGALVACAITGAPVKFIGVGEKIEDLERFNPKGFVGRILGMGDIEALLEKAKEAISEEDAQDIEQKLLKGDFTLIDLYSQMEAMKKMGPLSKVIEMIPGMGQLSMPKEMLHVQEEKLKKWKHIMGSMTQHELEQPAEIGPSRIERIANGSGASVSDVRELLKQYRQAQKMMKMFKGTNPKQMERMMKRFGGKFPGAG